MREEDRIRQIILDMAEGKDFLHKLKYDQRSKTIRPVSIFDDPDGSTTLTAEDATLSARKEVVKR